MDEAMEARTAGMTAEDQAVFQRVWERVMGRADNAAPLALETGEEPVRLPAPPDRSDRDRPGTDFPQTGGMLGESCRDSLPLLRELMDRAMADRQVYQALARRAGGGPARVLTALASQEQQAIRALSAAAFLISGSRYWPGEGREVRPTAYLGALRRQFIREQEVMSAGLAGAEAADDPCLGKLLWDHARAAWDRACRLRALVEQA